MNRIARRPWVLDTATPGLPIWKSWMKIAHIEYTGYAAAGNMCVLNDVNGFLVWQARGGTTLENQKSYKISWCQGLTPEQIDGGGKVIVYIE